MSVYDKDTTSELLQRWNSAKKDLVEVEARIEKYKKLAKKIMSKTGSNVIESSSYTLNRQEISRNSLSKNDVPKDIWDRYSKSSSYDAYYLRKNK
jgi:hypothetical protein